MGRKAKPDPPRYCAACGSLMSRKRINGRMEDMAVFMRRRYCDRACMAKGYVSDTARSSALRKRAKPFRGTNCESCGATTNLHAHHIDGQLQNNSPENIQTLCGSCHASHHHRARRAGETVAGRLTCDGSPTAFPGGCTDCGR